MNSSKGAGEIGALAAHLLEIGPFERVEGGRAVRGDRGRARRLPEEAHLAADGLRLDAPHKQVTAIVLGNVDGEFPGGDEIDGVGGFALAVENLRIRDVLAFEVAPGGNDKITGSLTRSRKINRGGAFEKSLPYVADQRVARVRPASGRLLVSQQRHALSLQPIKVDTRPADWILSAQNGEWRLLFFVRLAIEPLIAGLQAADGAGFQLFASGSKSKFLSLTRITLTRGFRFIQAALDDLCGRTRGTRDAAWPT